MTADPRDYVASTQVGTSLRDAAVTPSPDDFLGPTNAGQENPHGPLVVNPEIHASEGVRPVRPGPVDSDPTVQDTAETGHATAWTDGTAHDVDPAVADGSATA